eukprot:1453722-Pleurochrysis_carterae.AAC.3
MRSTVRSICSRYGSPRSSTYFRGKPCAEKSTWAVPRSVSGSEAIESAMMRADAARYPGRLYHAGTTVLFRGKSGSVYLTRRQARRKARYA